MAVGSVTVLCAACNTGTSSHPSLGSPTDKGVPGLRNAARAWSKAFLTGSIAEIRGMEGAACVSAPTAAPRAQEADVRAMRAETERSLAVPLASIRIKGVLVRRVTATSGDAEVRYELPASVVGNDDWVAYGYQDGQWKVTDCHAPIGGESSPPSA